jgi:NADH-quinone oxidoreductase subunit J
MDTFLFIAGGFVALAGTFLAVSARHIFHAALGLAIALAGTAGLCVPLGGEIISVIQLLVYLGAVGIAIVFTLMLSPPYYLARPRRNPLKFAAAGAVAILFTAPLAIIVERLSAYSAPAGGFAPTIEMLGQAMLNDFVLPFELISLVLTIVVIGAIVLARDLPTDKVQALDGAATSKAIAGAAATAEEHLTMEEAR